MKKTRKIAIIVLFALSIVMIGALGVMLAEMTEGARLDESKLPTADAALTVFDQNDTMIRYTGYISLKEISPHIINAFLSVEDKRFYKHKGLDLYRIVGAMIENAKSGKLSQGGSTISNQLVKNTQLSGEKTIERKIREAKITLELERKYSKDEILEMYLNVIYFGKGIYGVNDACQAIYEKSPSEVSPIEAASLAATVANPSLYSAIISPDNNLRRTKMILRMMHDQEYLSDAEYQTAVDSKIIINYGNNYCNYRKIYVNSTLSEAKAILKTTGNRLTKTGYKIYTYYDDQAQNAALTALSSYQLPENKAGYKEILIGDNKSSGIIAYVSDNAFSQTNRQPGSLLKPFIYAKAIDNGIILPDTPLFDSQKDHNGYLPTNFGNASYGWISARNALAKSVNTIAVDLLETIGVDQGYKTIKCAGIPLSDRDRNLSLALGGTTYGQSCRDIAEGYMTIANQGLHKKCTFIREIRNNQGKTLYKAPTNQTYVFSRESAYLTLDMLRTSAKSGTAKQLKHIAYDVAAKTGTVATQGGNSDAWCAAITSKNTFVCRYSSDSEPLDNSVTGGNLPTKTIRAAMKNLYADNQPDDFTTPPFLKEIAIDKTIKEKFHKLVPYKKSGYGESETILGTNKYIFDAADPEKLLIGEIHVDLYGGAPSISFDEFEGITYDVLLNGTKCTEKCGIYQAEQQRFPIGKLEIYCKKQGKTLWKTTRLLRLY